MHTNRKIIRYKNFDYSHIYLALVICSVGTIHSMDTLHTTMRFIAAMPDRMSTILTRHSAFAYWGIRQQTNYANHAAEERLHQADQIAQARIEQIDHAVGSHVPQFGLCSIATFAAGLGIYNVMHNINHDKKPEQSARKCWFGAGLAVFGTGYLYARYRNFENRRAQALLLNKQILA